MRYLFVVIITHNPDITLVKLLEKLIEERLPDKLQKKIIIVDNHSRQDMLPSMMVKFPQIEFIFNNQNYGFARAANKGITTAIKRGADKILLINQDVVPEKGFLGALLAMKESIVSPAIVTHHKGKHIFDLGGKINWWIGRTYHVEKETDPFPPNNVINPDYLSGCCLLVDVSVFQKIGLFDERFFMYFEDADFCLRARYASCSIALNPKVKVMHNFIEGRDKPISLQWKMLQSNLIFIIKHLGFGIPMGLVYIVVLGVKIILDKSGYKMFPGVKKNDQ